MLSLLKGPAKGLKLVIVAVTSVGLLTGLAATGQAGPRMLVDVKTGKVLDHEDAFQKWYPASLTKLMTAYTVFRAIEAGRVTLDTPVVMSQKAAGQPASKMYLKPGDRMTLDAALKIMLVKSANDVAYAIGETVAGSMPAFVALMNREAQGLGMTSSRFINANGLPGKGQYTTARDLALLAVALKRGYPQYGHYFALEAVSTGKKTYGNYNMLIGRFNGADGMKTGFICASGFNQVSSATRNGRTVVSIVLGTESLAARADLSADMLAKGLQRGTFGATSLTSLKPYGANRDQVIDVSKEICSKHGKKVRSESKDEAGRNKMTSPYIHERIGQPVAAFVAIVPAGKSMAGQAVVADLATGDGGSEPANVPIPLPRPLD